MRERPRAPGADIDVEGETLRETREKVDEAHRETRGFNPVQGHLCSLIPTGYNRAIYRIKT